MHTEQKWLPLLSRAAACGLAGVGLTLLLSWLAAFAMNRELLPEVETRLLALICCALACMAAGAFSPRPEQGRALGGAMTWAVWMTGYLILKAAVALTRGSLRLVRSRAHIDTELAGGVCGEPRAAA